MPLDQGYNDSMTRDKPMPLGDHLEDLRLRLIYALLGIGAALAATLAIGFKLIAWLAQPLLQVQAALGYPAQTITTEPTAGFTSVYLPVTLIGALILACPWVLVGLYQHERRAVYLLTPFSTVMMLLGVLFTRYVLLPVCLLFFFNFAAYYPKVEAGRPNAIMSALLSAYGVKQGKQAGDDAVASEFDIPTIPVLDTPPPPERMVEGMFFILRPTGKLSVVVDGQLRTLALASDHLLTPMPQLGQYVKFAAFMTLGVVAAFQLPVVMLLMGWTGLFDPVVFAKNRRYALFICLILGAVLTPTDFFSMFVLAGPLYLLFEFGLVLLRWADRRRGIEELVDDAVG
jgi:sec-independent protein translocase protein TatC